MNSAFPSVAVVVVNYNGAAVCPETFATLMRQSCPKAAVWIVDNGSTDGSAEEIAARYPSVTLVRNRENLGWAGGNNVGVRLALEAGAAWVWLLNNDVSLADDCLSALIRRAEGDPQAGILSPVISSWEDPKRLWFTGGRVDFAGFDTAHVEDTAMFRRLPDDRRYVSGCAMLVKAEVFRRVGLFDERFFMYSEDADFCVRAARRGFRMDVVEDARLRHRVSASTTDPAGRSPAQTYYILRSHLLFWRKHLGWWKFHRRYCLSQLGKWVNGLREMWADEKQEARANAIMDALWYYLTTRRSPREWPKSPWWFKALVLRRPWLVAELMAFRVGGVFTRGRVV